MLTAEANASADEARSAPRLRCVLVCDLADSTALIERLGDAQASLVLREHDRIARQALVRHHGQEIDKTDGFLALFQRPIEAVAFALDYQQQLHRLGEDNGIRLRTRVGIHVGELLSWRNTPEDIVGGAKPVEVEGLAKAIAARLMSLADPGQVLLSESAYSLALRARNELDAGWNPRWKEHGRYRLHGVASPLPVFEVSAHGAAPHPPRDKIKAKRIRPWYRWPPVYAALALALIAAPLWYALKPAPAIAFIERDWIVVGDVRNLTGETLFDRGLESAIRVGLEESRYVNVLSQAKQKQMLQLMQADTDQSIDRLLGSELAERAGARAVMLATISQHAGRLRFTAELVDPATQATVYAHSAEVDSLDRVLDSVDSVMREVRSDLGESLAQIEDSSTPLPQAMTANLDALRAYSLGLQKESATEMEDARQAFQLALSLDPQFASAEAGLGRYWYSRGDADKARLHYQRALAQPGRLTSRERLSYEATLATISGDPEHLRRWETLLEIYPDFHAAAHNLAQLYRVENQFETAVRFASLSLAPQSPTSISSSDVAAMAQLGLGNLEEARRLFESARSGGGEVPRRFCASIMEAVGETSAARECLQGVPDNASIVSRADAAWFLAVLAAARGDEVEAGEHLSRLEQLLVAAPPGKRLALEFGMAALGQRLGLRPDSQRQVLLQLETQLAEAQSGAEPQHARPIEITRLALAFHALQVGEHDIGNRLLVAPQPAIGSPYAQSLLRTVQAFGLAIGRNDQQAIGTLESASDPHAPVLTELALLRIAERQGDVSAIEARRTALQRRRHAALAEYGESHLLLGEYLLAMREPEQALISDRSGDASALTSQP